MPRQELQPWVTFHYVVTANGPVADFLYPEWGNLRFNLGGDMIAMLPGYYAAGQQLATLFGPTDRAAAVTSTGGRIVGMGFTPLGWLRFLAEPADRLANAIRPLGDEFGPTAEDWRAQLLALGGDDDGIITQMDEVLAARLAQTAPPDATALRLDAVLRTDPPDVVEFASRMATSTRTLNRECLRVFGFPPKRLLRRQRFLETLGEVRMHPDAKFIELLEERYFDQSHFIRDFRAFIGMSPRAYLNCPRGIFHVAEAEQTRRGITLSFKLPEPPPPGAQG